MSTKPAIKGGAIANHLRADLTNSQLTEKYQLSSKSGINVCSKLFEAKAEFDGKLEDEMPLAQDRADLSQKRALPRNYLLVQSKIHQASDPDVQGLVLDITDKGLQVAGMRPSLGETNSFLIPASGVASSRSVSFQLECRWYRTGH